MSVSFRTELPTLQVGFGISHQDGVMSIGSCFTENIGIRLRDYKFCTLLNPFGIIYNPISLSNMLHYLWSDRLLEASDLVFHQGQWHSFMHHGNFSGLEREATLERINFALAEARTQLPNISRLFITLGTSKVFVLRETGEIVANCHRFPASLFERRQLHIFDIVEAFEPILRTWKQRNPNLQVIFSVSPVRHLRDGFVENQRSKAALLIAVEHLCQHLNFAHYFPAYELMMDDLRDYRFYEADMVHPNAVAIDYIWRRFGEAFFTAETHQLNAQIAAVLQAVRHRPFHAESEQHQAFIRRQLEKIDALEQAHPYLDFNAERAVFRTQMAADQLE